MKTDQSFLTGCLTVTLCRLSLPVSFQTFQSYSVKGTCYLSALESPKTAPTLKKFTGIAEAYRNKHIGATLRGESSVYGGHSNVQPRSSAGMMTYSSAVGRHSLPFLFKGWLLCSRSHLFPEDPKSSHWSVSRYKDPALMPQLSMPLEGQPAAELPWDCVRTFGTA